MASFNPSNYVTGWPNLGVHQKVVYTFLFERNQIEKLKSEHPQLIEEYRRGGVIDQGFWMFRGISANPAKF